MSCNLKIILHHPLESKAFSSSKISYLRWYFQELLTSISVVAAMLPIMAGPNTILKSKFVNSYALTATTRTPLMLQLLSILQILFYFDQGK